MRAGGLGDLATTAELDIVLGGARHIGCFVTFQYQHAEYSDAVRSMSHLM